MVATPASVADVRSTLRHDLAILPESVREDAALVVSELLGNAMRHASSFPDGRLIVSWGVGDAGVEISVTDGCGPTMPAVGEPDLAGVGGRGLSIVASVAATWGVERCGRETTVWAVVPLHSARFAPA